MSAAQVIIAIWIGLVVITLVTGGVVLAWAIKTGQFSDQDRARYLPLGDPLPEQDRDRDKAEDSEGEKGEENA